MKGWPKRLLDKCVHQLTASGNLAKTRREYSLALRSLNPDFLRYVIGPVPSKLRKKSVILLGEPNVGKTPVAIKFMMADNGWPKTRSRQSQWLAWRPNSTVSAGTPAQSTPPSSTTTAISRTWRPAN